jgi:hypothetical protein
MRLLESFQILIVFIRIGLRYLGFHHVATRPLPSEPEMHIAGMKPGLREVEDMKTLIQILEAIGLKEWFRSEIGMSRP